RCHNGADHGKGQVDGQWDPITELEKQPGTNHWREAATNDRRNLTRDSHTGVAIASAEQFWEVAHLHAHIAVSRKDVAQDNSEGDHPDDAGVQQVEVYERHDDPNCSNQQVDRLAAYLV